MPRRRSPKREKLLVAAEACFVERGFRATTIAVIAERAEVPLGNVYYYYKSKDAFAEAVVAARQSAQDERFAKWAEQEPSKALRSFVENALGQSALLARSGCPTLSIVHDLKREGSSAAEAAQGLMTSERAFLRTTIVRALGDDVESPKRIERLTEWLGSRIAGIKAHAHGTGDAAMVARQRKQLLATLRAKLR